jgi:uncharacterized protein YjbJ (UPF0337 family)
MSNLKDKAKEAINDGTSSAKEAAGKVVDKSKRLAHTAGDKLKEGGKRLQGV